jgi:hypothetical protein
MVALPSDASDYARRMPAAFIDHGFYRNALARGSDLSETRTVSSCRPGPPSARARLVFAAPDLDAARGERKDQG